MLNVWNWIVAHQAIVSGAAVALLDLVFALVPSLEGNGVLHSLYLWIKGLASSGPKPQ